MASRIFIAQSPEHFLCFRQCLKIRVFCHYFNTLIVRLWDLPPGPHG